MKFFGPDFSGRDDPNFSTADCLAIYCLTFGKVSVYLLTSCAKPGNEVECRIYGGWVK